MLDMKDELHKDPIPSELIFLYIGLRNKKKKSAIYLRKMVREAGLRVKPRVQFWTYWMWNALEYTSGGMMQVKNIRLNDNGKKEKCENWNLGTLEGYKDEEKLVQGTGGAIREMEGDPRDSAK